MAWYKKQLAEKLKKTEKEKLEIKKNFSNKFSRPGFDPGKINNNKNTPNPVAARNINRPKTDKP